MSRTKTTNNERPLVIIDTLCILYKLIDLRRVGGKLVNKIINKERDAVIKAGVDLYNTLYFLPHITDKDPEILWVGDNKTIPYWRSSQYKEDVQAGLIPSSTPKKSRKKDSKVSEERNNSTARVEETNRSGYKGNRDTCPSQRFAARKLLSTSKALTIPGYEADDVAAAVTMLFPDREIYLLTVDSDWLQLVSDKVTWICTTGFNPGYRDLGGMEKWFAAKLLKEPKCIQQEKLNPADPYNIVRWKHLAGDKSDNLPKGTPLYYFDLKNPPVQHKLWLRPGFKELVESKFINRNGDPEPYFKWVLELEKDLPTPIYNPPS